MKTWIILTLLGFSLLGLFFSCKKSPDVEPHDFRDNLTGTYLGTALTYEWNSQFGNSDSVSWDTTLLVFKVDTSESYIEINGKIMRPVDYENYNHFFVEDAFVGNGNQATAGFWAQDSLFFKFSNGGLSFKSHYQFIGTRME